jgi:hypothetical protein
MQLESAIITTEQLIKESICLDNKLYKFKLET